jgi:tetratricopeptide (TPR) repeat protein/CHAT domain-containing protein
MIHFIANNINGGVRDGIGGVIKKMQKNILLILFWAFCFNINAQERLPRKYFQSYIDYNKIGNYASALTSINLEIKEYEKSFGPNDTIYAFLITLASELNNKLGYTIESNRLNEIALKIRIEKLGKWNHQVAINLNNLALGYKALGDYKTALPFFEQALAILKKSKGEEHPDFATSLNNLAQLYSNMGQYEKALPLNEQALKIRKTAFGEDHPDVAMSFNNLASLYSEMGQYLKALSFHEQALKIYKKSLGEEHPDYALSLSNLAQLYADMGQYKMAIPLNEQALKIRFKVFGDIHPNVALSLNNLASLYSKMGQYEKALPLQKQSLEINKKVLGEDHLNFALCLNNLAQIYSEMGQFNKALSINENALRIGKKALGENHPIVAMSLNNLALSYLNMGQYEKALPLNEIALAIFKKFKGEDHLDVATSLCSLAGTYSKLGDFKKALKLNEIALRIRKEKLDENHPDVASTFNNIGSIYSDLGQYSKAISYLEKSLEIKQKTYGGNHPSVSISISNLAFAYSKLKQNIKAISLYEEAISINKKTFELENPVLADMLIGLAIEYSILGDNKKALQLNEQVLNIFKKTLVADHPSFSICLNNIASIYSEIGQFDKSFYFQIQCLQIKNRRFFNILPSLSEEQKVFYLKLNASSYEIYDALIFDRSSIKDASSEYSFNNSLLLSNVTMRSNELIRNGILHSNDSILIEDFENWLALKRQYASAQSMSLEEIQNKGIDLKVLEDSIESKERSLSIRSQIFQTEQEKLQLNFETVKSRLAKDEAFLMFHSFDYYNGKSWTDSVLYAAYVVRPNQKEPEFVKLFEQVQLDSLMLADDVASMMAKIYQPSDSALYNLVWKPITGYLGDAKKVYIAPSGKLHKLAFAAIGDGTGHVLSDKYEIHQVLSAQDFVYPSSPVVFNSDDKSTTISIAMFGGINYDQSKTTASDKDSVLFSPLSLLSKGLDRGSSFGYLPATKKEIESIQSQFKQNSKTTSSYSGLEATEAALRSLEGDKAPKILHIATHGYFAPDPKEDRNKSQVSMMGQENRYTAADNPLLRSGLMMAGSNASWKGTVTLPGEEDGILTAQEVSNLNLLNTQLVVLSACETGLGDIKGREGVFGLQRAFRLAGAKYLLLSLWRIPDEETSEYMQLFYSELLKQNDITKAYKSTQTIMRQNNPNSPMNWAGMVLVE